MNLVRCCFASVVCPRRLLGCIVVSVVITSPRDGARNRALAGSGGGQASAPPCRLQRTLATGLAGDLEADGGMFRGSGLSASPDLAATSAPSSSTGGRHLSAAVAPRFLRWLRGFCGVLAPIPTANGTGHRTGQPELSMASSPLASHASKNSAP